MEIVEYYALTVTNAFKLLAPYVAFIVGGYFVFIKMPFLFLKKSMDDQKKKMVVETKKATTEKKYSVEDYEAFKSRLKLLKGESPKAKEEPKKEQAKTNKEEKKKTTLTGLSPEEILGFKKNGSITKAELKKRYFELLKQNHPDRVASMGSDFKKLAEKNTKEINQAYEVLKKKAA